MKRSLTSVCIASLLVLASCSQSDKATAPTPTNTWPYSMTATIDNTAFKVDTCLYLFPNFIDTTDLEIVGWEGYPTTKPNYYPQMYFFIYNYHGVGTYVFTNPGHATADVDLSATSGSSSATGSVTITATAPYLVGIFTFTTTAGNIVSNGRFTAQRQ